ncbi:YigZ family protein [Lachnospiraceae bacterium ZAX-1]
MKIKNKNEKSESKMEAYSYKTLYQGGSGEIVEKKSRFIATLAKIESEEEAFQLIAQIKKKHWDASHNCFAFVLGKGHELQRCSDDGEPSGTAGRPMLEVLLREDIHNALVIVTRYFGGTLLGTGGLLRAYQKAALEGFRNSTIIEKQSGIKITIKTDYSAIGKIQYILAQQEIATIEAQYTDSVVLKVIVAVNRLESFTNEMAEGTNGTANLEQGKPVEFGVINNEVIIF